VSGAEDSAIVSVDVVCRPAAEGWSCAVAVDDAGQPTRHRVTVQAGDLGRLDPAAADPTELVRRSFAFLLEREPPGSILREFDLMVIGRYFPEYEATIRGSG
jgi:hypothetical protein